jgi:type II secretory pathway component PulL
VPIPWNFVSAVISWAILTFCSYGWSARSEWLSADARARWVQTRTTPKQHDSDRQSAETSDRATGERTAAVGRRVQWVCFGETALACVLDGGGACTAPWRPPPAFCTRDRSGR